MGTEGDATRDALAEVDNSMSEHMGRHRASNSPNGWGCDTDCRRRALERAILAAGYLPPGQADALRAEVARAEARGVKRALQDAAEAAYAALDPVASQLGDWLEARADQIATDAGEARNE